MQASTYPAVASPRYAKRVEVSKRIRWDIERDVLRGRRFDFSKAFLPDPLSKVSSLDFLSEGDHPVQITGIRFDCIIAQSTFKTNMT